jgi:FHS family L-fucose permease-like MFS transporter
LCGFYSHPAATAKNLTDLVMSNSPHQTSSSHSVIPRGAVWPFVLLASCFLWWGVANNITDPLVKVFKEIFGMSTFQASLIQMAFYGGYFCMALPGAMIARRFNYKTGVLVGLGIYAAGCGLLYPAMLTAQFAFFCLAFYVLACGLGILETNANPYVLALGSEESATRRLNFAQSFNPVGSVAGILICQVFIMARLPFNDEGQLAMTPAEVPSALSTVIAPYLAIAAILVVVWLLILAAKMPLAAEQDDKVPFAAAAVRLLRNRFYLFAVFAQFCYVGLQITVWTYTNFYIPEQIGVSQEVALQYHTGALILFGLSRWVFTGLMNYFRAATLLALAALAGVLLSLVVVFVGGMAGVISLVALSGCMSLMFPTIFGLGCSVVREDTKLASSGLIMAIIGGAVITPAQGALLDAYGVSLSYLLPLACFAVILFFGLSARRRA